MKFKATRFDRDVWIHLSHDKKSYEYLCTHVDDFCIFSKWVQQIMNQLQAVYTIKSARPPDYYLGNNYKKDGKGHWNIGCKKYIMEVVS
eukprot:10224624-Ditylum_brightwellii.AAC.2